MMIPIEEQNLAIARIFIEQFLGKGDMEIAADVLDENVQAITGLKPDGAIDGREALFAEVLQSGNTSFNGATATVFYCGDDTEAKTIVAGLLEETAVEAIDVGGLSTARYLEPAMMLLIQLAYMKQMGQVAFKLLRR
jgi:8-hydroxy-5-deazaflavin:NADPH oxidoreductase